MGKINLLVAKYNDSVIYYSEYKKSVHHGKIYCPFCNPPLLITDSGKGYFMAWKGKGGHNCGAGGIDYINADWKGRELIEYISNEEKAIVKVDLNCFHKYKMTRTSQLSDKDIHTGFKKENPQYYTYKDKKKIFRDVIRNILQMANIIKRNSYEKLKDKLLFKFQFDGNELLSFDDSVINSNKLNKDKHHQKHRFVIFKVESIKSTKQNWYINAYTANGIDFSVKVENDLEKDLNHIKNDTYAIAFGKIIYSKENNKFFLVTEDSSLVCKITQDLTNTLFNGVNFEKFCIKEKKNLDMTIESKSRHNIKNIKYANSMSRENIITPTEKLTSKIDKEKQKKSEYNSENIEHINLISHENIIISAEKLVSTTTKMDEEKQNKPKHNIKSMKYISKENKEKIIWYQKIFSKLSVFKQFRKKHGKK